MSVTSFVLCIYLLFGNTSTGYVVGGTEITPLLLGRVFVRMKPPTASIVLTSERDVNISVVYWILINNNHNAHIYSQVIII